MSKTFQPDSLHPYIMDARLKKGTGSGGISNIPIASANTLGGIKVPADSGITIDADGAISGVAYSTTEHKTGRKWIDGKDIYEKTVSLGLTTITDNSFDVNVDYSGIETLIDAVLEYRTSSTYGKLITSAWINTTAETFNIKTNTTADSITESYLIIQYTKTN